MNYPVFPTTADNFSGSYGAGSGMTLREYYIGQALVGLCAAMPPALISDIADGTRAGAAYAKAAIAIADKTIEQLEKSL